MFNFDAVSDIFNQLVELHPTATNNFLWSMAVGIANIEAHGHLVDLQTFKVIEAIPETIVDSVPQPV